MANATYGNYTGLVLTNCLPARQLQLLEMWKGRVYFKNCLPGDAAGISRACSSRAAPWRRGRKAAGVQSWSQPGHGAGQAACFWEQELVLSWPKWAHRELSSSTGSLQDDLKEGFLTVPSPPPCKTRADPLCYQGGNRQNQGPLVQKEFEEETATLS